MDREHVSPCGADAMQGIHRIMIRDRQIGIDRLDVLFDEVLKLEPLSDKEAIHHLMAGVKEYNYIPPSMGIEYESVIFSLYQKKKDQH